MPELPEVETVRRTLAGVLKGQRISRVEVLSPHCVAGLVPGDFARELEGRGFATFGRRGKYLLLGLDDGRELIVHLRMTGQFIYTPPPPPGGPGKLEGDKHVHLVMELGNGGRLQFRDQRKFGRVWFGGGPDGLRCLGPEPLSPEFTEAHLARVFGGRKAPVKSLLLNQEIVAGLGNIYADEILHAAGVRPDRPAADLGPRQAGRIHRAVGMVLRAAIADGGTTISDYRDGLGGSGLYGTRLRVYGRAGAPCMRCGGTIARLRVGGRSSYFCPGCQA